MRGVLSRLLTPGKIALVAAVLGAWWGWRLVRHDVELLESAGFTAPREMRFVVFMTLLPAAAAYLGVARLRLGPRLDRVELSVFFPRGPQRAAGYREAASPTLGPVLERLAGLGYALDVALLDEEGRPLGPAGPSQPLLGAHLRFTERSVRLRNAGVFLRLSPEDAELATGLGFLVVDDRAHGAYEELGQFLIVALGEQIPGLEFKGTYSALSPEPAASLLQQLPERPRGLPAA